MIWGCQCPEPRVHSVHANRCERCGRFLDSRVVDSDENVAVFRARLEPVPDMPTGCLDHAERRNVAGRKEFGLRFLDRNNLAEGREEAADGLNYAMYHWLKGRRYGIEEINPRLLSAARYFALAHRELHLVEVEDGLEL